MKTDRMPFCCEARGHIFFIATPKPRFPDFSRKIPAILKKMMNYFVMC